MTESDIKIKRKNMDIENKIKKVVDQIISEYKPEKIILFGSAARGNLTIDSDIDLFIIKKDVPFFGIDRIRELRKKIKSDIASDLLVYKPEEFEYRLQLGDPFIKSIIKEGKILYG